MLLESAGDISKSNRVDLLKSHGLLYGCGMSSAWLK